MNIILEGPDAAGKTTLANKLSKKYNMNVIHSTSKTRNDLSYHLDLLDYCQNTVFDRFHVGEMVYPEIYNRSGKLSLDDFLDINQRIIDNHDILIIFYASNIDTLKERLIERGELNYLSEIEQQNNLFKKYAYIVNVYDDMLLKFVDVSMPNSYDELDSWIDSHFEEITPNIAYRKVCKDLIEKGYKIESSNLRGNTLELTNYSFTISNIENALITLKTGKVNYIYLAGEILWYWSGRDDLEFISKFSKMWSKLSDDGEHSNSAYGYILQKKHGFNQIDKIIDLLKKDPHSRRAVLNLNVPNINVIETKDEICTIALVYQIRDNKLYCTCIMRSNDVNFGLRNDLGYFITLQQYIAHKLGVGLGSYTHYAVSMHLYERDFDFAKNVAYGSLESDDEILDISELLKNRVELIDYIDNSWVNKDEFYLLLKNKNIIRKV